MDGGGKHIKEGRAVLFRKKNNGAHGEKPKRSPRQKAMLLLRIGLVLIFCFLMITPLRSCSLAHRGYIGESAAQTIAFGNAGIVSADAGDVSADLVRVDGRYCYKIDFGTESHTFSYIIDAASGSIIAVSKNAAE